MNQRSGKAGAAAVRCFSRSLLVLAVSFFSASMVATTSLNAQFVLPDDDAGLGGISQAEIIDSVAAALNRKYVFPEMAEKMERFVRAQYKDGAYEDITGLSEFVRKLSEDLREVCKDRHLRIGSMTDEQVAMIQADTAGEDERAQELEYERYNNFHFQELKRLAGNIGYVRFDGFSGLPEAGETAIAAMNFLGNSDALIFDMRYNGGGSPSMIQLISSYFFDEPKHLNSFYLREEDTIKQFWTQNHVVGKRMEDVPIWVLTSNRTFSGAEEFTYNLKNMERATIVGETTGGGAHPVDGAYFPNLKVRMAVPMGRAINPITGTNWEGVGVTPHIEVPADEALLTARLDAMKTLKETTTDERKIAALEWGIVGLEAQANPITLGDDVLRLYAGSYGPRQVYYENGELFYQREGRPKFRMIPLNEDTFWFEEIEYFRLHFVRDESGQVTEVVGLYDDGHRDRNPRDSN